MDHVVGAVPLAESLDERRHLLDVACRALGSRVAAERVVDEAYRRWYRLTDPERVRMPSPRIWLTQVVDEACLTRPAPAWHGGDQREILALRASCGEDLEPVEWARSSLGARRARPVSARREHAITVAVRQACSDQDGPRLRSLLAPDATAFFDSGGKIRALTRPVRGDEQVAGSLLVLLGGQRRVTLCTGSVNGRTGLVARCDDQVAAVLTLDIADSLVVQVWAVLNPDKLRSWNRSLPR
ncbi:RNA polymerase sigma-70 factor (ECF subfamily) [Streptomyces sp. SAI-117]|uniref:RNA polymerase subunit sigma n=1 Tax=unclassified Streptomyces TaxID=2593676 RepID=UPI002473A4F9|nr:MULTISPECIES: RNA polymerase subunit sigma [unclassified Streptomyces]MDH6553758.1 RNA polymerase sigma-70 factor (ECF subfamily) [Streptomyces sp. SAI-041]MDH6572837.1 RNA polymerase sigma-70 factor (ECF subfamily) [Streptomyces sp. SAI-117]MDH6582201.1 RNA polymerase sigma-70 factor (ECF subfamily) [Streptomyces sp. SAI-133]